MIWIQSPLKRDYIIELLNDKEINNVHFTFVKQDQMKLFFDHTMDSQHAAVIAKQTIKQSEYGSALFFSVNHD